MKPRTKRDAMLCCMAEKLPPLTCRQFEYPKEHIHTKKGYYWKNGLVWCQCCGETYTVTHSMLEVSLDLGVEICEGCGEQIKLEHARPKMKYDREVKCYSIITTFQGWQVIRCFEAWRINSNGKPTRYEVTELFQIWMDAGGKETIVTRPYSRGPLYIKWKYNEPWVIGHHNGHCSGYYEMSDLFDVDGYYIYPRAKVITVLRRNGWKGELLKLRVSKADLMRGLLTNSNVETIAKARQFNVLEYWIGHGIAAKKDKNDQSRFFSPVKIAIRNRYVVNDASLWYDMIDALRYLNLDTNCPKYVCPDNLLEAHDTYVRRMERKMEKEEQRKQREEALSHEQYYIAKKGCYLGVCFGDENFSVTVLQSVLEFVDEGRSMHHCVYTNGYYTKDCLILSVKNKESKRLATVELSLKDYKVIQCRGVCNSDPKQRDEIISLISRNKGLFIKAGKSRKEVTA